MARRDKNDRIFSIAVKCESKVYCGVKDCQNSSYIKKLGLYPIPPKDRSEMRCIWLRNMGYSTKNELTNMDDLLVCEAHFKQRYKNYTGYISPYKSLTIDAIPTEHVPYKNPLEKLDLTQETQGVSDKLLPVTPACHEQGTREMALNETTTLKLNENIMLTNFCEKYLGHQLNIAINIHRKLSEKPDNCSMEFTDEFKRLIVSIYMENARAYQIMETVIGLPSVADIKKFISSKPEVISEHFISMLTNKVESMSTDQVNCALCVQLLSIEPSCDYDLESDIVLGHCQSTSDTSNILSFTATRYALVAMARGICSNWHQIVSFSLLPYIKDQSDFNKFIKSWIANIVMKLLGIGLTLNVLIPSTDNLLINAFVHMRISDIEPYLEVNGKKIFYLFDPFNLLKLAMLNMRREGEQFEYMSTMWRNIRKFWEIDQSREYKLAPDLTKDTFDEKPKQSNQTIFQKCAQILSLNTAAGIEMFVDMRLMEEPARHTVKLIRKINCLFDTNHLNSLNLKQIHTNMFSSHLLEKYDDDIWVDLVTYFKKPPKSKNQILKPPNSTHNGEDFVDCIITTLQNIRLLRESNKIYTSQSFNQDPLVAIIDEAHMQFGLERNFKAKELIQVMKENLMHSALLHDSKNDNSLAMKKFAEKANKMTEINVIYKKAMDISDFSFIHANSLMYIATYIINKICQGDDTKLRQSQVHILKGANSMNENNKLIFVPDNQFLNFLEKLQRSYYLNIKFAIGSDKVVQSLMDSFEHIRTNALWENEMSDEDIMLIKRAYFTIATFNNINNIEIIDG